MRGQQLSIARKHFGLTQTELAQSVNITPKAISKYEKEGKGLSDSKLQEIAHFLRFDVNFFYQTDFELQQEESISFRARSKVPAKKRDQAIALSSFGIKLSDWMDSEFELPNLSIPDLSEFEPEEAALALRAAWELNNAPIPNMISLLEVHGIRVFSITEVSPQIDAYSFWNEKRNRPFVFLSTSKSAERRRMDAAHELAHIVLHRKAELVRTDTRLLEKQADRFAAAFLMPDQGFRSSVSTHISIEEIMRVKQIWKVSAFAVVVRMHSLNMLSDWQYHNLCVHMSKLGMRTQEQNSIVPERSQVADKIFSLVREEQGGISDISRATKIPYDLVLSLTFNPPVKVVKG